MKRPVGRPRKESGESRERFVGLRLRRRDYARWEKRAVALGLSVSAWLRGLGDLDARF